MTQRRQGGYQVIIILPIKSKMAAAKKQFFLQFTNDYKFGISDTYQ